MPKGFKKTHGYATVDVSAGGLGYREIAEHMTASGDKMNHSTARNVFMSAMGKIASDVSLHFDGDMKPVNDMAKDPRFQSGVYDILSDLDNTYKV